VRERKIEREKLALEHEKLAIERARLKQDSDIKKAELEAKERADNDEVRLLKRYGEALAQVLAPQTDDVTELPSYFRGVEMQFDKLKIPSHFRARLIHKYVNHSLRGISQRQRNIIAFIIHSAIDNDLQLLLPTSNGKL